MIFDTSFDLWLRAIDLYLDRLGLPPLCLANMPAGFDAALETFYARRVRAWVVASVLAGCMVQVVNDRFVTKWG